MGGGDLNLKKSWHPSTMRNMEKVWKAEQRHDQEKKRIAELQREIREEKAREDIQKFAEDKGILEKKDEMKLDWMYKGPGGIVDREEYLLGRAVDKSFEQLQQAEKIPSSSSSTKNHVDHNCVPTSIFSGGDEQVDMARKLQEDPLFAIKKREIESRTQILNNPVKLKQLQQLIKEQKSKKGRKQKKDRKKKKDHKKNKHHSEDSCIDDDGELDALLVAKYKKLKEKLNTANIIVLKSDESATSDSEEERSKGKQGQIRSSGHHKRKHHRQSSNDEDSGDAIGRVRKIYGLLRPPGMKPQQPKAQSRENQPKLTQPYHSLAKNHWTRTVRMKLSKEELEHRRKEMMSNAEWRDRERERNVAKYREEDRRDKKQPKDFSEDFLRKQLSLAASQSSVESRIKSNIYNIQRSGMSMDRNFARR